LLVVQQLQLNKFNSSSVCPTFCSIMLYGNNFTISTNALSWKTNLRIHEEQNWYLNETKVNQSGWNFLDGHFGIGSNV